MRIVRLGYACFDCVCRWSFGWVVVLFGGEFPYLVAWLPAVVVVAITVGCGLGFGCLPLYVCVYCDLFVYIGFVLF